MFNYNSKKLKSLLAEVIQQNTLPEVWAWIKEKSEGVNHISAFNLAFVSIPRKTGKAVIKVTEDQHQHIQDIIPHFSIKGWTIDRLSRVYLLLQLDPTNKDAYFKTIENLFPTAEMSEQVALYSSLPLLAYPPMWQGRCAEGIRSNIGDVLEAIICNNPYPASQLSEAAWNQLVLKAFFTEKEVQKIIGIDDRANQDLALILSDYAHERWAAGRGVNPQLWRCVGKFVEERIFTDIEKIWASENEVEKEAAALACWDSQFPPAKALLNSNAELKDAIEKGTLTWAAIADKMKAKTD